MPDVAAASFRRKCFGTEGYVGYTNWPGAVTRKASPYTAHIHERFRSCRALASHPSKVISTEPYKHSRPAKSWSVLYVNVSLVNATEFVFSQLCKQWKEDTLYDSSLEAIWFHPAYQTIMAMGERAVPLILRELDRQLGHWFYALTHIVRKDMARGAVNLEDARQRWLEWGRQNSLIE